MARSNPGSSRSWVFTSFNAEKPSFDADVMVYQVYQREKCPTTGKDHWQGFVRFKDKIRLTQAKELLKLDKVHFEVCRNPPKAIEYCMKQDTRLDGPFEFGSREKADIRSGSRSDLQDIKKDIESGVSERDIADKHFNSWVRYNRSFRAYRTLLTKPRNFKTKVIVVYGPTNCGKSYWAETNFPDALWVTRGNSATWFSGYEAHQAVILDEFYGWLKFDFLLRLLDRYPLRVEHKGGDAEFIARHIIITSNDEWNLWYKDIGLNHKAALERRLDIIMYRDDQSKPWLYTKGSESDLQLIEKNKVIVLD